MCVFIIVHIYRWIQVQSGLYVFGNRHNLAADQNIFKLQLYNLKCRLWALIWGCSHQSWRKVFSDDETEVFSEEGFVSSTTRHYLQPPISTHPPVRGPELRRQQGNDVRKFAVEFSGAAEGLGYNDAALKDLFNSALDEPLSWWRMRGQDHLTFGECVEFLACFPAKVAGVPQVVGDEAAAHPGIPGLVLKLEDPPMRSVWAAGIPRPAPESRPAAESPARRRVHRPAAESTGPPQSPPARRRVPGPPQSPRPAAESPARRRVPAPEAPAAAESRHQRQTTESRPQSPRPQSPGPRDKQQSPGPRGPGRRRVPAPETNNRVPAPESPAAESRPQRQTTESRPQRPWPPQSPGTRDKQQSPGPRVPGRRVPAPETNNRVPAPESPAAESRPQRQTTESRPQSPQQQSPGPRDKQQSPGPRVPSSRVPAPETNNRVPALESRPQSPAPLCYEWGWGSSGQIAYLNRSIAERCRDTDDITEQSSQRHLQSDSALTVSTATAQQHSEA